MKILVIGHENVPGGAQNALRKLVGLLVRKHQVEVVLPIHGNGSETAYYRALGLTCHEIDCGACLPNLAMAQMGLAGPQAQALKTGGFDLVITNTIVMLLGALLARQAGIPHLFYVHEYLDDIELLPACIGRRAYLAMIAEASDGLLVCSKFVASQFPAALHVEVLPPHDFSAQTPPARSWSATAPLAIQCIGEQSQRKNARFGLVLCKALRLRGLAAQYHIIGKQSDATAALITEAQRRESVATWLTSGIDDPYAINAGKQVLTLVAATSEPYGLTIVESLQRGVPVVASRSGGPQELLPEDCLFPVEDLECCARAVMRVAGDYGVASQRALALYHALAAAASGEEARVEKLLERVRAGGARASAATLLDRLAAFRTFKSAAPDPGALVRNIGAVARQRGSEMSDADMARRVQDERAHPGSAIAEDLARFDIIPFCYSSGMDALYREGLGLAVELAAHAGDTGHLQMAAYILSVLLDKQRACGRNLSILALGDGLGLDAIRLASCGFAVDYADVEGSAMARVAALNCETVFGPEQDKVRFVGAIDKVYDAVVCLEVAEHVPHPVQFVRGLAARLKPEGLLFLSECFDGIEDRWPTHLYANEALSHRLPELVRDVLRCVGFNRQPFAKPYVFVRRDAPEDGRAADQPALFRAAAVALARLQR
ncbi:MAG: glycosyltransferase [Burkholderiaceae bacterium]|jgi:glycosyltransferase involved in cell wall biosynthesis/SAM-dependent methyltransferase|nr:glycosyltransferase [Burkholderiaceae bacterium]